LATMIDTVICFRDWYCCVIGSSGWYCCKIGYNDDVAWSARVVDAAWCLQWFMLLHDRLQWWYCCMMVPVIYIVTWLDPLMIMLHNGSSDLCCYMIGYSDDVVAWWLQWFMLLHGWLQWLIMLHDWLRCGRIQDMPMT
jgi:hypothetical protein